MRLASTDLRRVATAGALALLTGGCALQLKTGACDKPVLFFEPGTNIVLAPPAGLAEAGAMQRLELIGGMIQAATASVSSDYTGSKIIRLVPERADDQSCRPEAIRYMWSGCSRKALLVSREPVTVVWPYAQPAGEDDIYLRFSISNWVIGGSYDIRLNLKTAEGRKYTLEATVPIENVAFRPRRISRKTLDETAMAFGCDLYERPALGSPKRRLERCEMAFDGLISDRASADGRKWFQVKLRDYSSGWMPAPRKEDVSAVFPEFGLLDIAVSFQHYLQYFQLPLAAERQHGQLANAVAEFRKTPITPDNNAALAMADVILGSTDLLQGAREGDRRLLTAASKRFADATHGLAYQSEAVNLNLMAEILRCCLSGNAHVTANRIDASLSAFDRSEIESHAMRLWVFLKLDPASDTILRNLATLLRMLQDEGKTTFGDRSVAETLGKLAPIVAASEENRKDLSCEELREQAVAQAQLPGDKQ